MKLLEERIVSEGRFIQPDIVKVDGFLNHRIDPILMEEIGKEIFRLFQDSGINKILTVEASGIAMALEAARYFRVPMVFAKKSRSVNVSNEVWTAKVYSFTHKNTNDIIVSKQYLEAGDKVLLVDDFLANGEALRGLISLCDQAGAQVAGCCAAIEKAFQPGGKELRERGYRVESLAAIEAIDPVTGAITFRH